MLRRAPLFLAIAALFAALACTAAEDDDSAANGDGGSADATPTDAGASSNGDANGASDGADEPTPTPEPTEPAEEATPTPTVDPATRCTGEMPEGVTPDSRTRLSLRPMAASARCCSTCPRAISRARRHRWSSTSTAPAATRAPRSRPPASFTRRAGGHPARDARRHR
ncbi:MAG: hypothetical protein U5Q44_04255 [Dehalococcoidia bacterium]|nr:hypothetical protein [Dehalococcoidia bacterium]